MDKLQSDILRKFPSEISNTAEFSIVFKQKSDDNALKSVNKGKGHSVLSEFVGLIPKL